MKRVMKLYDSCRTAIKVVFFGFVLIAIGFLISNENVNLFYTFKSGIVLFIGELFLKVGEFIVMNLPLIFMLNVVCKKANNVSPVITAMVGYFVFITTTMLFSSQSLDSQVYATGYGINSVFNLNNSVRYPLETGLLGSLLVAYMTRVSFVLSRHRSGFSITNMFSKEVAGIIYNAIFCLLLGIVVSYTYPTVYGLLQKGITFISENLLDPFRIGLYSVLDRLLSMLGLSNLIKYPFWFTSVGGSYSNALTGQSILGDINIWKYVKDVETNYIGAGRFITPYYVINLFIIPGIYLGILFSVSDKKERGSILIAIIGGIILSVVAGNPMPMELLLLFTSPLLLVLYLILVGISSACLVSFNAFLGFNSSNITNTAVSMPGTFPDFIVNIRDASLAPTLRVIVIIGLIAFILSYLMTFLYYRVFAYDFANTGKSTKYINKIVKAVGGLANIEDVAAGLFRLNIYLINSELIDIETIQDLGLQRVVETRKGVSLELGTSSYILARKIKKLIKSTFDSK